MLDEEVEVLEEGPGSDIESWVEGADLVRCVDVGSDAIDYAIRRVEGDKCNKTRGIVEIGDWTSRGYSHTR